MMNPLRRRSPVDIGPGRKLLAYILLGVWTVVVLFPLYWIVVTSFKLPIQVDSGPKYMPFVDYQPTLDNWRYILVDLRNDTIRPYINTVVVGLTSSIVALALGSSAAYALVRFRYRPRIGVIGLFIGSIVFVIVATVLGSPLPVSIASAVAIFLILYQTIARRFRRSLGNSDVAFWLISQRILPPVVVVIPVYVLFQRLGLLDTWQALIITYVATNLPIVVWLMRDYFSNVPVELEESAAVDGASPYRIFRSIVVPVSMPGLVATFLFVLVFAWNEYLLALFLTTARAQTLPVIIVAILLERFISRGLLIGAVKG